MPDSASNVVALFPPENQRILGQIESSRAENEARKAANAPQTRILHSHETIHPPDHASVARSAELPQNVAMDTPTRHEVDAKLEGVRQEMLASAATLKGEFAELRADMRESFGNLRAEMHKGFADQTKWIVGTAIAGVAMFVTLMTFVLNNAIPKVATASQPPAIIINVPPAAPAPAASR